jgi:hypothetical protein
MNIVGEWDIFAIFMIQGSQCLDERLLLSPSVPDINSIHIYNNLSRKKWAYMPQPTELDKKSGKRVVVSFVSRFETLVIPAEAGIHSAFPAKAGMMSGFPPPRE